jgi:tetratricopeptide (TPR) repeat protein
MLKKYTLLVFLLASVGAGCTTLWAQESITGNLALAQQYFASEDYDKALDQIEPLLENYGNPIVYQLGLDAYVALEEYRKAENLAKKWSRFKSNQEQRFLIDLIYLYNLQSETKKADKIVDDILKQVRNNPSLAYLYGKTFADRGYPRLALEMYTTANSLNPNMNFDYQKALLYGELGDVKSMYTMYVSLLERSPTYLNTVKILLTRALNNQGDDENIDYLQELLVKRIQAGSKASLNELLIHLYIEQQNFRGAFTQLKALQKQGKVSFGEILRLARVTFNNEDYALAERIYEYVLKREEEQLFTAEATLGFLESKSQQLAQDTSTQKEQWQGLARLYEAERKVFAGATEFGAISQQLAEIYAYRLAQLDTAEAILRQIFTKGFLPNEVIAETQIQLADLLLYKGERWDAIIFYKKAEKDLEQAPIGQQAKFKRAKAAYYVGDFEWAQSIFDVLKESTSKTIANDAMRYALLISDNMALDSTVDAMQAYAKADLFLYQGQLDSSLFILERMLISYPEHPIFDETLLLQGDIFYQKRNYAQAEKAWQEILNNHKEEILADDALIRLANLQLSIFGNSEKAMELYQQLFTQFVDSFYASEARKKFRALRGDQIN